MRYAVSHSLGRAWQLCGSQQASLCRVALTRNTSTPVVEQITGGHKATKQTNYSEASELVQLQLKQRLFWSIVIDFSSESLPVLSGTLGARP
jgi:hypothetical protein